MSELKFLGELSLLSILQNIEIFNYLGNVGRLIPSFFMPHESRQSLLSSFAVILVSTVTETCLIGDLMSSVL